MTLLALSLIASLANELQQQRSISLQASLSGAPRLGLGMAALGRPLGYSGYIGLADEPAGSLTIEQMQERCVERGQHHAGTMLELAYSLGLRFFDCARSYGRAEEYMASWLASRREMMPHRTSECSLVIASKWGYEYSADWRVKVCEGKFEVQKHSVEQLERQLGETRALLPGVSLYQIHSATRSTGVLQNDAVLDALAHLRDEQGIKIGITLQHPQVETLVKAIAVERAGAPLFASVQATFNLLDQSAGPMLQRAAEQGVFIIIKEALANGRLTSHASELHTGIGAAAYEVLRHEAAALGTNAEALALAWVLSFPWVGMCLSGASTCEQLRSNADALRIAPLEENLHARLATALGQDVEDYWATRRALEWN